jgi:hypothetical protein
MLPHTSCQPEPLGSWIPKNTGGYFPHAANKYTAIPGLCFEPDRNKQVSLPRGGKDVLLWLNREATSRGLNRKDSI